MRFRNTSSSAARHGDLKSARPAPRRSRWPIAAIAIVACSLPDPVPVDGPVRFAGYQQPCFVNGSQTLCPMQLIDPTDPASAELFFHPLEGLEFSWGVEVTADLVWQQDSSTGGYSAVAGPAYDVRPSTAGFRMFFPAYLTDSYSPWVVDIGELTYALIDGTEFRCGSQPACNYLMQELTAGRATTADFEFTGEPERPLRLVAAGQ